MYEQIASILKEEIMDNKYSPSGNTGTQAQMAERFNVSLITIRKAIALLARQGLLNVKQGKGTFVKQTLLSEDLTRLTGVDNLITSSHLSAQVQVLCFEIIDTPKHFESEIKKDLGSKCLHIERIHIIEGGVKAGFAEIWLPGKYGEEITISEIEQNTVYQLYERKWNMALGKGKQFVRADAASAKIASALDIQEGSPVLSIKRQAYSATGELIEYMLLNYEHTQYSLSIELNLSSI